MPNFSRAVHIVAKRRLRNAIVILSLLVALVIGLQALLHGEVSTAGVEKKTWAELKVTDRDVTVRVPYAETIVAISALAG